MLQYAWIIPLLPFIAFVAILFVGKRTPGKGSYIAIGATSITLALSIIILVQVVGGKTIDIGYTWLIAGKFNLPVGILIDPLTAVMLMVVTGVSLLVQIYSIGYMHGEPRFTWYFAALSLFSASMLSLVLANNYLQMYISWELVGLCSYLLIGFWYEKKSASNAAIKAFITTRIGDVGFVLGIALLFFATTQVASGTFEFHELSKLIQSNQLSAWVLTTAALLLFGGAVGKSAQFPLHVWLPDAMEGPTPVSALIHAATMVAAGVYLVARSAFIFEAAFPSALTVVAIIGTITALMAATIALTMSDIKRILAYSTISQLGYMMVALGVGGVSAGIFHLMTHAFFKALLFLGAGSVIHGTGTQNIYEMGGLSKKMKVTMITFLIASLSLAGIFPLSGFWSKDEILAEAFRGGHFLIFGILLFTAFLTAFYMFRLNFLVFFGKERNDKIHAHESPPVMSYPLIALAIPAALLGLVGSPFLGNAFSSFLEGGRAPSPNYLLMASSSLVALFGIGLAWVIYHRNLIKEETIKVKMSYLYRVLQNKYYFDEIYDRIFVQPVVRFAGSVSRFDSIVIDRTVDRVGRGTVKGGTEAARFDQRIIDGIVNGIGFFVKKTSQRYRRTFTGYLQRYALIIFAGFVVLVIIVYILLRR